MGIFDGFAGTVKGSFFNAPEWVDQSMAAGRTNQAVVCVVAHRFCVGSVRADVLVFASSLDVCLPPPPSHLPFFYTSKVL
jgi:hypothetical protein